MAQQNPLASGLGSLMNSTNSGAPMSSGTGTSFAQNMGALGGMGGGSSGGGMFGGAPANPAPQGGFGGGTNAFGGGSGGGFGG